VSTQLSWRDTLGTLGARTGFARNNYKVTPGLYAVGTPESQSPVVVTANYKLTFDHVRKELHGLAVWLLVVDTRGINVWCAAGKGTFSTEEVGYQVLRTNLKDLVSHRNLIIPQLAAVGVSLYRLPKKCGFRGQFGPIRIGDLPAYLQNNGQIDDDKRTVTFSFTERATLIPVELQLILKPLLLTLLGATLISGITPEGYGIDFALSRGRLILLTTLVAIVSGAILTPLLLPLIPFRQFWLKGAVVSLIAAALYLLFCYSAASIMEAASLSLWITALGSYMAMNFTGSTPFTSLTGVEYEMRRGLPFQVILTATALLLWVVIPFTV